MIHDDGELLKFMNEKVNPTTNLWSINYTISFDRRNFFHLENLVSPSFLLLNVLDDQSCGDSYNITAMYSYSMKRCYHSFVVLQTIDNTNDMKSSFILSFQLNCVHSKESNLVTDTNMIIFNRQIKIIIRINIMTHHHLISFGLIKLVIGIFFNSTLTNIINWLEMTFAYLLKLQ